LAGVALVLPLGFFIVPSLLVLGSTKFGKSLIGYFSLLEKAAKMIGVVA
jgi:hypothetical protein